MYVRLHLEELRLAGARISTQEDVDLRPEVTTPTALEVLASSPKQLQQDSLLDILILVDTGG